MNASSWLYFGSLFSGLTVYKVPQGVNGKRIKVKAASKDTAEAITRIN